MNEPTPSPDDMLANATREEILAALFANMVIQQTNMAMMLLGKAPHPETGQYMRDIDAARMFIDQLEMLEVKTKGNLSPQEAGLLKQALNALHMTFVQEAGEPASAPAPNAEPAKPIEAAPAPAAPSAKPAVEKKPSGTVETPPAEEESRKKFSKKY